MTDRPKRKASVALREFDIEQVLDTSCAEDLEVWAALVCEAEQSTISRYIKIENASQSRFNGEYSLYPGVDGKPEWRKEVPGDEPISLHRRKHFWCLATRNRREVYTLEASEALGTELWPASTGDWCRGRRKRLPGMSCSQVLKKKGTCLTDIGGRSLRIFYQDFEIATKEHVSKNTAYRLKLDGTAVLLDIGAHVGVVSLKALQLGAKQVICVEPAFNSYVLLRRNLAPEVNDGKAIILHRALGATSDSVARLWRHNAGSGKEFFNMTDSCPTSLLARSHSGQPEYCSTTSMTDLLETYQPTHIKIDCEGSENLLQTAVPEALKNVRAIYGEYDAKHHPEVSEQVAFHDFLNRCGFEVDWPDKMATERRADGVLVFAKRPGRAAANTGMRFTARRAN